MDQDVKLGVAFTITQADLPFLRQSMRLGEHPVVYRVHRKQKGGGFGDQDKHPFAWGILVYVDGQLARINSARGAGREWNDLDKVERWLLGQGFNIWWTRNDLEEVGALIGGHEEKTNPMPLPAAVDLPDVPVLKPSKFSIK